MKRTATTSTITSTITSTTTSTTSLALLLILPFIFAINCSNLTTDITPDRAARYHSLRIKVNVKSLTSSHRQSFKVLLKYNQDGDKMLFLSPLNQIYGLLVVKNEIALMVNSKKKRYWQGPFKELLKYMWGPDMDFQYHQFKALMVRGTVPQKEVRKRNLNITLQPGVKGSPPHRLEIQSKNIRVRVKISNRKTSSGKLSLKAPVSDMRESSIRDLME